MTPLNADEATALLRQREIEFTRVMKQVQHYGQMEALERRRANRIAAEMDELRRQIAGYAEAERFILAELVPTPASSTPSFSEVG